MNYGSFFDIKILVANAQSEFSRSDPEAFKAFLLASMVGLRRAEIDQLEWTAFDWQLEKLHIGVTEHFAVKSQGSIGDVDLDRELMEVFRNFYEERCGSFVVESRVKPRPGSTYAHYRCQRTFKRLTGWLREHGGCKRVPSGRTERIRNVGHCESPFWRGVFPSFLPRGQKPGGAHHAAWCVSA